MTMYSRFLCAHALAILAGWYSLKYGWGLAPKSITVLLVYFGVVVLGWPLLLSWVRRGNGNGGAG
jgi:hypothetical protein